MTRQDGQTLTGRPTRPLRSGLAELRVRFYGLLPRAAMHSGLADPQVKPRYTTGSQQAASPVRPESWRTAHA